MKRITSITATAAVIAAAALAVNASAAKPPSVGEETLGNNLSVPAIFVPSTTGAPQPRVGCDVAPKEPGWDFAPSSVVYPGYWLQQTEATWGASCIESAAARDVTADWGDNLTNGPNLAAGRPIRVEVGLLEPDEIGMTGYQVDNLTPLLEDRLATYGSKPDNLFVTGTPGAPVARVFDAGSRIKIEKKLADGSWDSLVDELMSAEINSTGAVVYGYNWGTKGRKNTPSTGDYRLTFTTGSTVITALNDALASNPPLPITDGTSTTVLVTLTTRGGGGGNGGNKPTTATGKAGAKGAHVGLR